MGQVNSELLNWIQDICKRFTNATEWPLIFTEIRDAEESNGMHPECCWFRELTYENSRIGCFHMDLPETSQSDRIFLTVKELAELVVELISESISDRQMIQSHSKDVSTLAQMGMTIFNERDLFKALQQLLKAAIQLMGYHSAAFFLMTPKRDQFNMRGRYRIEGYPETFENRKFDRDAPDFKVIEMEQDTFELHKSEDPNAELWLPENIQTGFCCPVMTTDGPLGTLWVYDRRQKKPTERDRHILMSVAVQIANLLERVVLLQESTEQHRIQHDLRIASETQTHGRISDESVDTGMDIAALCTSRYEIGGDLFELISVDQDRTIITIGDASGDSVPAAMVMSSVRGALRAIATEKKQDITRTDLIMEKLNSVLYSITPAHQFMSMLFAVYDKSTGEFTYTNAGHPTPIHCHQDSISTLQSHGMLLGVMDDASYERSIIKMDHDDVLVMYSDGISEAMNKNKKLFRSEGIIGAVKHIDHGTDAETILRTILNQVKAHTQGLGKDDDKTLLVIRTQGIEARARAG